MDIKTKTLINPNGLGTEVLGVDTRETFDGYYVIHRQIGQSNRSYYAVNQRGHRKSQRFTSYTEADAFAVRQNMRFGYDVAEGRRRIQEIER